MLFRLQVFLFRTMNFVAKYLGKLIHMPTPYLYVGDQSSVKMCETIAELGHRKVLLVTDSVLIELELHKDILATFSTRDIEVVIYKGVTPDPKMTQVKEGLALLKAEGCDAVLALGGGSAIDAAKVIAAGATNTKTLEKMVGMLKVSKKTLPLFAVSTTAGTGSETTPAAVISDPESGEKQIFCDPKLVPMMAALDAKLMLGLPKPVTAATGIDALTHAVDAYLSTHANEETDRLSIAAVRLIFKNLAEAFEHGDNQPAREAMALASFFAGVAFSQTNVGYVHAIAHRFGAKYHTPHGLANAIAIVPVLRFYQQRCPTRLAQLAGVIGVGTENESEEALSLLFIDAVESLNKTLEIPSKHEAMKAADIPGLAKEALSEAHGLYHVPHYMNQVECEKTLQTMLAV